MLGRSIRISNADGSFAQNSADSNGLNTGWINNNRGFIRWVNKYTISLALIRLAWQTCVKHGRNGDQNGCKIR